MNAPCCPSFMSGLAELADHGGAGGLGVGPSDPTAAAQADQNALLDLAKAILQTGQTLQNQQYQYQIAQFQLKHGYTPPVPGAPPQMQTNWKPVLYIAGGLAAVIALGMFLKK